MTDSDATMSWLHRRIRSFSHAVRGLSWVLRHERNGKYHLAHVIATVAILPFTQKPLTVALALAALGAECMNSGVERAVDVATDEYEKNARIAKDAASAAVLCVLAGSALVDVIALASAIARILA